MQTTSAFPTPPPTADVIEPVVQRCVLILPSTGAFDSRTYRIAATLASRGHVVTVVARMAPGLATEERHPAGYTILRVPVSAMDGLPRWLRGPARRLIPGRDTEASDVESARASGSAGPSSTGIAARVRRGVQATVRLGAIGLTARSQRIASERVAPTADIVHAMAYMGIPVGLAIGRRDGAPVVYDARDIYVDAANIARMPAPARRLFGRLERRWARRASRVVTVNQPYADVMAERFDVLSPLVVMNCSVRRAAPAARPDRIRQRLGIAPDVPIVLYHGGLARDRGIEQLIEALPLIPSATLVLLGYGPLQMALEARVLDPALDGRLAVLPAVPPAELLDWVASADVVAMPIQPTTLNHRLTTPNKLFEAMAAAVPIVASDLPGMATIVRETGCGTLVDATDPAAIAAAVGALLESPATERDAIGRRGYEAHLARYNWESQAVPLLAEYGRLTGRPW